MTDNLTFPHRDEFKPLLVSERLTADDLKRHLILTFGSLKTAGQRAGYGDDVRVAQILSGYAVPKNPEIIKRIAEGWHVDLVVLTQLFERLRGEIKE